MKNCAIHLFAFTYLAFILSCGSKQGSKKNGPLTAEDIIVASLDSIAPAIARSKVENMITIANCVSPSGNYTTEVHTTPDGYTLFRQEYTYNPSPFEAIIENDTAGYSIADPSANLPPEAVYVVRSHAFHLQLLQVQQRFHSFSRQDTVQKGDTTLYRIRAKDELDNDCTLYFDPDTGLLSILEILNPDNKQEMISTQFTEWRKTGDLKLPYHINIYQGSKLFTFDFLRIDINSPVFKKKIRPTG